MSKEITPRTISNFPRSRLQHVSERSVYGMTMPRPLPGCSDEPKNEIGLDLTNITNKPSLKIALLRGTCKTRNRAAMTAQTLLVPA